MIFILAVASLLAAVEVYAQGTWSYASGMPSHGRAGLATTVGRDGLIYAISGQTVGDPDMVATVEAYDPRTGMWWFKPPIPSARTGLAAATAPDGRIFTFGGGPESHGYYATNTVEVYNPATNLWTTAASMPTARTGLKAITGLDGRIYVIGGYSQPDGGHLRVLEIYNPATNTWTTGAPMPTARQQFGAARAPDGRIYVVGGSDQWRSGIMNVVEVYNPATNTWTTVTPMPTARDGVGAAAGPDGLIYAMGGWSRETGQFGDITATVEAYNPAENTWHRMPSMLVAEYSPGTATGIDCRVYAIGGGGYGVSSVVQAYTPPAISRFSQRCVRTP